MKIDDKSIVLSYLKLYKLYKDKRTVYFHMAKNMNSTELEMERRVTYLRNNGVKLP